MRNPAYLDWVRREFKPINHLYEEFAYVRSWEAFTRGGEAQLHPQETLLILQCSPERCGGQGSGQSLCTGKGACC